MERATAASGRAPGQDRVPAAMPRTAAPAVRGGLRSVRLGRLRLCRGHVLLEDLTALAGAGHVLRRRCRLRRASCAPRGSAASRPLLAFAAAGRRPACGAGAACCRLLGLSRAAPPLLMAPSSAPTATVWPSHDLDLAQHAGNGRRNLDRHLVRLELDQRLVGLDRVAGFLNHLPTIASVMLSPRVGTRISVAISDLTSPRRSSPRHCRITAS